MKVHRVTRAPRLLHLTTTAISLDWLLSPQLDAFTSAGFDLTIASAPGPHVEALTGRGFTHVSIPSLSRNMDLRADRAAWGELRALFDRIQPDIVHTHNPKPGVMGRLVARWCDVPIVVNTVHGLYAQREDSLIRRTAVYGAERIAASCSDAELVQNIEDVELLASVGVPRERLHLLGNGIDLDRFSLTAPRIRDARNQRRALGIDPSVPVIGIVGRLVWEKGYAEFFDAVRTLRARATSDFAVVVVGPAEPSKVGAVDRATILEMADQGVHFLGSRTDVDVLLPMFDLFVLPSYREGFPRAAMEASAMGVPVIATDVRGCRQVVDDGRTGLLVPARSSSALADAIETLLEQPLTRSEMGSAAIKRAAAEFDQQRVIARTMAVYRSLLNTRRLPTPAGQPTTERYTASIDLVATEASKSAALPAAA